MTRNAKRHIDLFVDQIHMALMDQQLYAHVRVTRHKPQQQMGIIILHQTGRRTDAQAAAHFVARTGDNGIGRLQPLDNRLTLTIHIAANIRDAETARRTFD